MRNKYKYADFRKFVKKAEYIIIKFRLNYKLQIIKQLIIIKLNFNKIRKQIDFIDKNNISHSKVNLFKI